MPLPALTKSPLYSVDNILVTTGVSLSDFQQLIFKWKTILTSWTSNPGTIVSSCDGAGTFGNTDNITDSGDIIWAASGSNHSWFVVKFPGVNGGNAEVLFDFCSATKTQAVIAVSPSVGFTGGTATAAPTASDAFFMIGTAANTPGVMFNSGLSSGAITEFAVHAFQASDGSYVQLWTEQLNVLEMFFRIEAPANLPVGSPGWANPCLGMWSTVNMTLANFNQARTNGVFGHANGVTFNPFLASRGWGSTVLEQVQTMPTDLTTPREYPISNIGLASTTASAIGYHGSMTDIWWTSTAVPNGAIFQVPNSKTVLRAINNMLVPWPAGTIPLFG